ncbi:MAG TPA: DNA mismatch repair protein MutS [Opitutaceae bacterium]|jgi:DNA mismatch repair protein MutS
MPETEKLSPMMQQYFEVRRGLAADTLLMFRLGDFYELFFDDAVAASRLLGLTLTRRQEHPMAGIPFHAAETYVGKLLAAGRKVAICDQAEAAKPGKLVKRQLTRILSPGTTLAASQLQEDRNHYLAAVELARDGLRAAWLDLSTGEFKLAADPRPENLLPILTAIAPAELLVVEGEPDRWKHLPHEAVAEHALQAFASRRLVTGLPEFHFGREAGAQAVSAALGVHNLDGFGIDALHPALGAAGALVRYATENLCAKPENLRTLNEYRSGASLLLDPATLRNLEIFTSSRGAREGSLIAAVGRTVTPAGARLLERWLAAPLLERPAIERRLRLVGELVQSGPRLANLRDALRAVRDIPRILGRLQNRLRNPRELGGIRDTLRELPTLKALLADIAALPRPSSGLKGLTVPDRREISAVDGELDPLPGLKRHLEAALADELPADVEDGGIFREGHDAKLDRLRALTSGNRTWLSDLEKAEQERTGIRSLKVRFTAHFGYYIEITKANLHLVPADYIRRQTTVGGERYVTESLRLKEKEIFHAEENALAREKDLFAGLIADVLAHAEALTRTANALAELDVVAGWADLAREWDYCQPELSEFDELAIEGGRHPVVEQMLRGSDSGFVPNDTALAADGTQIALITGPNMAGKSTYIRQVALIALLAHIGCWVPAKRCRVGLVDRIFSRIGASDDLAHGNSTFMVEMNETANILHHATARSLIVLDEIGRGTSTYDGLSIAWAVAEHLHQDPSRGPRTLFATHYQELTKLEKRLPRLKNYSVAVKEWNEDIVFLRQVVPGAADRSYGIQVARLAGLPASVIERARAILTKLEADGAATPSPKGKAVSGTGDPQLTLL